VYPELVTRGSDGKLESVRYLEFTALLLNELQKQANQLQKQARETQELTQRLETKDQQLAAQQREIDAPKQQNASINAFSERLAALERQARTANPEGLRSLARK
jgi:flagellar biosynthesis/type III secretory pathway chaperone